MGDSMGGLPSALRKSSTIHHTLSSISYTANYHTHSHTTDHLHNTNTTTPTTTSITTLTPIISPKQPRLKKTKKTLLALHPQPPQLLQPSRPSPCPYLPSCPRNHVPKRQKNPPRSPFKRDTHSHSVHSLQPKNIPSNLHTTGLASQHTPQPLLLLQPNPTQHQNINHSCTAHLHYSYTQYSHFFHYSYTRHSQHYHEHHYSHRYHQHHHPHHYHQRHHHCHRHHHHHHTDTNLIPHGARHFSPTQALHTLSFIEHTLVIISHRCLIFPQTL